jgi:hypothetical protein
MLTVQSSGKALDAWLRDYQEFTVLRDRDARRHIYGSASDQTSGRPT